MKIGLTGGIGSGKNFIANIFATHNFHTIDLDIISKKVMTKDSETYAQLIDYFGSDILQDDKSIDRKKLGTIIFNDNVKRKFLENVTHKAIYDYELIEINQILAKQSDANIISHAALMIESGGYKRYDKLIVIYTDKSTQIKRVIKRDNCDKDFANLIISTQMPFEEKVKFADMIIDNSTDEANAKREVSRIVNLITLIKYGDKHNR